MDMALCRRLILWRRTRIYIDLIAPGKEHRSHLCHYSYIFFSYLISLFFYESLSIHDHDTLVILAYTLTLYVVYLGVG